MGVNDLRLMECGQDMYLSITDGTERPEIDGVWTGHVPVYNSGFRDGNHPNIIANQNIATVFSAKTPKRVSSGVKA